MREAVAVDAGGTSTRALVVDAAGTRRGAARAAGGNPTSRGAVPAAAAVVDAIGRALPPDAEITTVLVAHAGERLPAFRAGIAEGLAALGIAVPVTYAGDLGAIFASGTAESCGVALIAGTGAIAGVVHDGALARVVDGTGWLLGDAGSGYWLGWRAARAASAELDGGPATALTGALLADLGLEDDRTMDAGRPRAQQRLISALYDLRPVELSRFAPLVFAAEGDEVAAGIVRDGAAALADLLRRARRIEPAGPLVLGGSALTGGYLRSAPEVLEPLLDAAGGTPPIPVADGLAGAAVLALRHGGVTVDAALHARLAAAARA